MGGGRWQVASCTYTTSHSCVFRNSFLIRLPQLLRHPVPCTVGFDSQTSLSFSMAVVYSWYGFWVYTDEKRSLHNSPVHLSPVAKTTGKRIGRVDGRPTNSPIWGTRVLKKRWPGSSRTGTEASHFAGQNRRGYCLGGQRLPSVTGERF